MKIKELKKCVNVCWSPGDHYPVMLAAGTAAQQIDPTFDSASSLDIYSLNLRDPGYDLELKSSIQTKNRFHKLVWSSTGVIVTGCEGGTIQLWSVDRLLKKSEDALLTSCNEHSGPVTTLDVNPYQKNLVASGAGESEILIWDLMGPARPMAPGAKPQPAETVQALAWNTQVQHILGSTFNSRCIVWDLRKNEPIMKLSDAETRCQWGAMAWHPTLATQLVIASKDDLNPVIQLWDLRLASSPLCTLSGHRRGVLSLSWSNFDSSLLVSSGRDSKVMISSPTANEQMPVSYVQELYSGVESISDVCWSPRTPGLLSVVSQSCQVHSLFGGSKPEYTSQTQSNILESFGSVAELGSLPSINRSNQNPHETPQLMKPPLFIQRPVRAKFAFGGKLVTFEKASEEQSSQKLVYISQVTSDPTLIEKCKDLDEIIRASSMQDQAADDILANICLREGDACSEQSWRYLWFFLRANFLPNFKQEAINLLGLKQDDLATKSKTQLNNDVQQDNIDSITSGIAGLSRGESTETEAELSTDTSTDLSDAHTLIERKLATMNDITPVANVLIPNGDDNTSMICRALVCGQIEQAVDFCLEANRVADALVIASFGSPELLSRVQRYHVCRHTDPVSLLTRALSAQHLGVPQMHAEWARLITSVNGQAWAHVLAGILTYADNETMIKCCQLLGDKLMKEDDSRYNDAAMICYICAGNHSALIDICRTKQRDLTALSQLSLLARRAAINRRPETQCMGMSERVLCQYALMLSSQGHLQSALNILATTQDCELRNRLTKALQQTYNTHKQQSNQRAAHADAKNYHNSASTPWQANAPVPRPSSVGPPAGGIASRSKYKVDPSVHTAHNYANYNYNAQNNNPYPIYNDQYAQPAQPAPIVNQPQVNPVGVNGQYYNNQPEVLPANIKPAAPGWNDPPPLTSKPKPKPESVTNQAPITHPLFGSEPPQHIPLNPAYPPEMQQYNAPQQFPPTQQFNPPPQQFNPTPQQFNPQTQQFNPTPQQFNPQTQQFNPQSQQFNPPPQQYNQQQYQQQFPPNPLGTTQNLPQPEVARPVVEKPPLPDEYKHIQQYFEQLREKCLATATSPHMRKKLDDVQRRLESLYDVLRENLLSVNGIESINECVSLCGQGDLHNGLTALQRVADGADFVHGATFLPGLKLLLQAALSLNINTYIH